MSNKRGKKIQGVRNEYNLPTMVGEMPVTEGDPIREESDWQKMKRHVE